MENQALNEPTHDANVKTLPVHSRVAADLYRKGYTASSAARCVRRSVTHVYLVLTGRRVSPALLSQLAELPPISVSPLGSRRKHKLQPPVLEAAPEHRAALSHVAAPAAAVAPPQPSPKLTRAERRAARAERRAARAAELERQRAAYAAPLTPATEPHSLRVEGYDPEFTPNPENFGQLD